MDAANLEALRATIRDLIRHAPRRRFLIRWLRKNRPPLTSDGGQPQSANEADQRKPDCAG